MKTSKVGIAIIAVFFQMNVFAQESFLSGDHKFYINEGYNFDLNFAGIRNNEGSPVLNAKDNATLYLNRDVYSSTIIQSKTGGISSTIAAFLKTGFVGIGTIEPSARLHILSSQGDAVLKIESDKDNSHEDYNPRLELIQDGGDHGAFIGFNKEWDGLDNLFRIGTRSNSVDNYNNFVIVPESGYIGIGTTSPQSLLSVNGKITTKEVKVTVEGWSDFVFDKNYKLKELEEVEGFIEENNHLPDIPSAEEVLENGVHLGEMNAKLLQKIEELTLYMIEVNKKVKLLEEKNSELEREVKVLKAQ